MAKNAARRPSQFSARPLGNGRETNAQRRLAAERAAAARDRITASHRRRRLQIAGSAIATVILVVAVLIVVKVTTGAGGPTSGQQATAAQAQVIHDVSHVKVATFNAVAAGTAKTPPTKIAAPPLTSLGKPEMLYVGAEYCPYCAAERWAMAAALSRFGTLHGVGETESSSSDVYPSTNTLTFHGATYTSTLLSFVPREIQSNQVVNGQYTQLDKLTAAQQAIVSKYNTTTYIPGGSNGSIPFVDIGGRYLISGASYDPGVLKGKSHQQIASALSDPSSNIAQAVDGTANLISAAICSTTGQKPATVCTSAGVKHAAATMSTS